MHTSRGFSLLEVMMIVVVIGLMATMIARLRVSPPHDDWPYVMQEVRHLLLLGRQEAITHRSVHRILFSAEFDEISRAVLEQEENDPQKAGAKKYTAARSSYLATIYAFPASIKIHALLIDGKDLLRNDKKRQGSIYITKEGLVQPAILQLTRTQEGEEVSVSFVVNPFNATLERKDGFYKP